MFYFIFVIFLKNLLFYYYFGGQARFGPSARQPSLQMGRAMFFSPLLNVDLAHFLRWSTHTEPTPFCHPYLGGFQETPDARLEA